MCVCVSVCLALYSKSNYTVMKHMRDEQMCSNVGDLPSVGWLLCCDTIVIVTKRSLVAISDAFYYLRLIRLVVHVCGTRV